MRPDLFVTTNAVAAGMWQTAVGSMVFVLGVALAPPRMARVKGRYVTHPAITSDRQFNLFCLAGGWLFVYGLGPLAAIPSIGALVEKGGAIWILGVMLGLRAAVMRNEVRKVLLWGVALAVYPALMLLMGGFLSYGTTAAIIGLSVLAVTGRSHARVLIGLVVATWLGITVFVNYFAARDALRSVIWSDAGFEQRIDAVSTAFSTIELFSISSDAHAVALDQRLNQNYFAGLAAERLDAGEVDYANGRSIYEGMIALIPRWIWPDKPVFGGSGSIVRDMTGLTLSETTSWGVGQVMEFYMNFGWASLIGGFLLLGWLIGRLDFHAAAGDRYGDKATLIVCFVPAVALVQPIGSLVELCGGAASAYLAALGWRFAWREFNHVRERARRGVG